MGTNILWFGRDYRDRFAATFTLDRTTVEASIESGDASSSVLEEVGRGLRPVSKSARERVLSTPFGRLMYQHRHPVETGETPISYWDYKRSAGPDELRIHTRDLETPPPGLLNELPESESLRRDTVLRIESSEGFEEIEEIYEHLNYPGHFIRFIHSPAGTGVPIAYPPVLYTEQPCEHRTVSILGTTVHRAYLSAEYGPHEAVWQSAGRNILLLVKPAPWTNMEWFERFLTISLRNAARSRQV